jgi:hypothetical protein
MLNKATAKPKADIENMQKTNHNQTQNGQTVKRSTSVIFVSGIKFLNLGGLSRKNEWEPTLKDTHPCNFLDEFVKASGLIIYAYVII